MDRERLKEVRQTDLTESRINEEFVDWLKTKGVTWFLVIMIILFAYVAWVRWSQHRTGYQTKAWTSLADAEMPSTLEDVAETYKGVGSVAHLARLRAAGEYLRAVQMNRTLGAADTAEPITDELRVNYLENADRNYAEIVKADDRSVAMTLLVTNALFGRAAVAESRGELEQARQFYSQAAQRAEAAFPALAQQAQDRANTVDERARDVALLTRAQLMAMQQMQPPGQDVDPVWSEPWLNDLLSPQP